MTEKTDPLVSVYITSYNYERFIREAIESVLAQTLQDFELIVIDDGSTDNSREVIETFRGDPRIIPIFQHNKGLNVTNNIALRAARGRYVMRLDADDWLDRHALEVLAGMLEREPQVGLVFPDYYLVDAGGRIIEQVRRHNFGEVTLLDQPAHGACTMIRRSALLEVGGYDETFRCQDGYGLWIRFIEHFEVRNVNLPLFFYRQHGNNLTTNEERVLATRSEMIRRRAETRASNLQVLGVIAVRGPSVDPYSPAFRLLGGKPLIEWTIEAALDARKVARVLVTTPDPDLIAHVGARYGNRAIALKRDPKLATPNTYLGDTLRHALKDAETTGMRIDAVLQLSIESPFRAARHIDSAVEVMELFETDSVIGVRPETDNFYRHDGAGLIPVRQTIGLRLEQEEIYREVGQMRLIKRALVAEGEGIPAGSVGHVVLDQRASIKLMSRYDWAVAELLVAALGRGEAIASQP